MPKLLIEGDPFETMCALAERFPGQPVGLVYEDGIFSVGVISWADLNKGDWTKLPTPIAEEEQPVTQSTDQRS